ncbi:GTP-binding protein HflX [Candidatus Magnetoovum chiemensis]|nr:GTP-binding protein HflX [Candidatus Magnetoovum chiemensis]
MRFDYIAAIGVKDGQPNMFYAAHLMPAGSKQLYDIISGNFYSLEVEFDKEIAVLEAQMERKTMQADGKYQESAILISVSKDLRHEQEESLDELEELAKSSDILVLEKVIQSPKEINPKYLMGIGRLKELIIDALGKGASLLIFDQDLSASQVRSITDLTEIKVIDRSQLILDIFARRAHSGDGKVQVELAQLKYMLPRLTGKGSAMSRLMGGIGARGPGEMKLEIDRRRVKDRVHLLERQLKKLSDARYERKKNRIKSAIPIVSIIGYTNAGKSTLLNALTKSSAFVEDKMFATLDTASRRLRFPHERDIIVTDTVGFIRDLPKDLLSAFKATLEELEDAQLLLHLVDISNPRFMQHISSVETILEELNFKDKPQLLVFNKIDLISNEEALNLANRYNAAPVCAKDNSTFAALLNELEDRIFCKQHVTHDYYETRELCRY